MRCARGRSEPSEQLREAEAQHEALSRKIDEIDKAKRKMLADARFPVEGLSVEAGAVTLNGLPLKQASSAEQLRCCLAIGAALNPKLRTMLVRDGSLLDEDSLRLVAEWAELHDMHDMQVIMERVGKAAGGIVIEDGEVLEEEW